MRMIKLCVVRLAHLELCMHAFCLCGLYRYMSLYWLQMMQLKETHPEADQFLRQGGFAVQRSAAALQEAQAAIAEAERSLSDAVFKAPFDGTA